MSETKQILAYPDVTPSRRWIAGLSFAAVVAGVVVRSRRGRPADIAATGGANGR